MRTKNSRYATNLRSSSTNSSSSASTNVNKNSINDDLESNTELVDDQNKPSWMSKLTACARSSSIKKNMKDFISLISHHSSSSRDMDPRRGRRMDQLLYERVLVAQNCKRKAFRNER